MDQKEFEENHAPPILNFIGAFHDHPTLALAVDLIRPPFEKGLTREQFFEWTGANPDIKKRPIIDMIFFGVFNQLEHEKRQAENEKPKLADAGNLYFSKEAPIEVPDEK